MAGNCEAAAILCRCAMKLGSAEGYFLLGMLYLDHQLPENHEDDLFRAHGLILQAASMGHWPATLLADQLTFVGDDMPLTVPERWQDGSFPNEAKQFYRNALKELDAGRLATASLALFSACKHGYGPALYLHGRLFLQGMYPKRNPILGSALLHCAAAQGNQKAARTLRAAFPPAPVLPQRPEPKPPKPTRAQQDLYLYAKSLDESGSPEQALEFYNSLREVHPDACGRLAQLYAENGDKETSLKYMLQAAKLGDPEALVTTSNAHSYTLLHLPETAWKNIDAIEDHLCRHKVGTGFHALSAFFLQGRDGVPCYDKGIYYLRKAIENGKPELCSRLATLYQEAWLDPAGTNTRFVYWLEQGDRRGSTDCTARLALHLLQYGNEEDHAKACRLARQGYEKATTDLNKATCALVLSHLSPNAADRIRWATAYRQFQLS